ncbi:MAG: anthranilate phosphoribosyltransferase [Elusimicrobiota bacterium]|nr:anthranilate phosphoribosyltransferase [Elusimicrobiota bacterium]
MNKFNDLLKIILNGRALDRSQARAAMNALIGGGVTDAQAGAFLAALRVRGETVPELIGFAEAMRARAVKVKPKRRPLLDTCGTGGDGSGTFNISTTVAFIAAGAGAAVAKHGNRAVSSRSGSADVLEALGVRTTIAAGLAAECVDVAGVGFLFAPAHHPAVAKVGPIRRQLGTRTVFNLLGPLSNPAAAKRQLLGVYSPALVAPVAEALKELGSEDAMVVSSRDGLDELSLSAPTVVARLRNGKVTVSEVTPESVGLKRRPLKALAGGDADKNAWITRAILFGESGPAREVCLFNAAAALMVAGLARDWKEGLSMAADSIDSGRAAASLAILRRLTVDG